MSFEVQHLTVGEEVRLRAIRLRSLADSPDAFGTTFEEANALSSDDWQRQLEHLPTFVANSGGADIGIARGARHDGHNDSAYLISMWVVPEMRGHGVAMTLIDTVVAWAKAEGFQRLVLDVAESNTAAKRLYLKMGFVANGILGTLPPPRQHICECQLEKNLA